MLSIGCPPCVAGNSLVLVVAVLAHVRPQSRRDRAVDGAHLLAAHAERREDPQRDREQPVGVAGLGRALGGAVEDDRAQVGVQDTGERLAWASMNAAMDSGIGIGGMVLSVARTRARCRR